MTHDEYVSLGWSLYLCFAVTFTCMATIILDLLDIKRTLKDLQPNPDVNKENK